MDVHHYIFLWMYQWKVILSILSTKDLNLNIFPSWTIQRSILLRIGYSTIETKEAIFFRMSSQVKTEVHSHCRVPDNEWSFQDGGLYIIKKVGVKILTIIVLYRLS
jgi:hypothetical protein